MQYEFKDRNDVKLFIGNSLMYKSCLRFLLVSGFLRLFKLFF